MDGFSAELDQANKDGVAHPQNLPFLFKPEKPNGKAILLIHGFGASPYEMIPLADFLCAEGYLALGVRLAGHGTSPEDLRTCQWQDWVNSVERGYACLQKTGMPIDLIGQSTGALIGLTFALQKELARLVLLSPFLKLHHPLANFAGVLKYLIPYQQRHLPYPEKLHYYERRPLAGIEQIGKLRDQLVHKLNQIKNPALVLAAEGDKTVAKGSGRALFENLNNPLNRFHLFGPEVPHVLSTQENPKFQEACTIIEEFLHE
jgi:carboxylesterase